MKIISRKEAKAAGLKTYFTGKPCINGHIAERNVSEAKCYECRKASWERVRRRKGKKPFKPDLPRRAALAAGESLYIGKPCKHGHVGIRWTHNGACKTCTGKAAKEHPRRLEYAREWRALHPERHSQIMRAAKARRRSREASGTYSCDDIAELLSLQKGRCAWCGKPSRGKYHVDHIEPVSKGGLNVRSNLQILCPTCNRRKAAKDPIAFARENGRLL